MRRMALAVGVDLSAPHVTHRHHVAGAQIIGGVCCVRATGRCSVSRRQRGQRSMMASGGGAVTQAPSPQRHPRAAP